MTTAKLDLVFLWHMHQPDYRDHSNGDFVLPWVYLHGIKDYADMAAHLERHTGVSAVVNFVPVLLEQIEDYAAQFESREFRDPLLRLLAAPDLDHLVASERDFLLEACFRSNHSTMLSPFPHYKRLHDLYTTLAPDGEPALDYLSGAFFADLVTWYHLAWTGESERRRQPLLVQLMSKGEGYSRDDRHQLLTLIGEIICGLIPRYRALAESGRVELSTTPQTHPLSPLLLDFACARDSEPSAPLPQATAYPGGRSRVDAQIAAAQASHRQRFGVTPLGFWPAEGAISAPFLQQLAAHDCRWAASGEGVLHNSLRLGKAKDLPRAACRPWSVENAPGLTMFFRNERLSDLIGFEYAKWHGRDAAGHFVGELEAIAKATPKGEGAVVSVIMDGENAWEHFPYNGHFFFEDLYGLLENHPTIRTTTYAEILGRTAPPTPTRLPAVCAGSWVYGTMSTWIGDADKNRAWDLLCAAKARYDMVMASGRLGAAESAAATAQLAICESSDWFWWFGDYNPSAAVANFDRLYRSNLANLYRLLQLEPPAQLSLPISAGSSAASHDGTMRRANEPIHAA
jgi:alpha-amylase/alpha-mannosidase (GH57 family)